MKLWTIQPKSIYDILMENGSFICDPEQADCYSWLKDAYDWYIKKMNQIIDNPKDIKLPIWAWYKWEAKNKKPDLRLNLFRYTGSKETHCCMELEIPDEEVLLSDYDAWHYVLNKRFIDMSANEKELDETFKWLDSLPEKLRNIVVTESWSRIFDIHYYEDKSIYDELTDSYRNWRSNGVYIQATFWELKKEYLQSVRFFKGIYREEN